MKRLLPFLLLALLLPVTINAHDFEVNGIYYNKNGTNATVTYRGTSYSQYSDEYSGSVTIPSTVTYNGTTYSVTTIGYNAFRSCSNLTSVMIPNSVTSISSYVFIDCKGLTSVTIGSSVTSIDNHLFSGCDNLTSITVKSGNTVYDSRNNCNAIIKTASNTLIAGCKNTTIPNSVTSIGSDAFSGCTSLTSVTIPNSVISIGYAAFQQCSGLTNVTIPNSVTSIGEWAFSGCSSLTSVTIPNLVTSISGWTFNDCRSLTSVTIPNSVTSIGKLAFNGCYGLTSVAIPNSVTSIGDRAFEGCGLTSLTIPNSVNSIGNSAFSSCGSLTNLKVESGNTVYDSRNDCNAIIETASNTLIAGCKTTIIPNSVTAIGNYAFSSCYGLTSVTFPSSVTAIGDRAFDGCFFLTSVICKAETPPTVSVVAFGDYTEATLYVPAVSLQAYQNSDSWSTIFTNILSIEELQGEKFEYNGIYYQIIDSAAVVTYRGTSYYQYNNEYTGTVTIPPTVVFIGETYPVTSIGEDAFNGCTALTGVSIPNTVISIGKSAFSACTGLTNVTIGNSVTSIGNSAFYYCTGLTDVAIPNSVTNIGESVFSSCSGLTSVTIGNSVTSIGRAAFYGCSGLTSVIVPNSVTSIGNNVFTECSGLTSIKVESGNTIYDSRNDCNAIIETASNTLIFGCKTTNIPTSVTAIGNNAFYGCTGLTSITIPNSVTAIGYGAFYCSSGLTSVTFPNSVTFIDAYAFYGCTGLTSVTIGISVNTIGNNAFSSCSALSSIGVESGNTVYDSRNDCNAIIESASNTLILGCKNTTIPNSVTTIGNSAFRYCTGLTNVTITNSVISIGAYAFGNCSGLTSVTIPNSVTTIGQCAFYRNTGLTSLTISSSVTSIGGMTFSDCTALTSVTIPSSVTSIGGGAFRGCTALTRVTIPNSVTTIDGEAFYGCRSLTKVICRADEPPTMGGSYVFSDYTTPTLYVPAASLQAYQTTDYWNRFTTILTLDDIPVETFESNGIYYYINGDEAVVTYRGTSYSEYSNEYSGTVNIPSTVIHDGVTYPVTTIGEYAFSDCRNLLKVIIPNSVTTIEKEAFYECTGLTSLTLPNSVTTIREAAFYGCTGLMGDLVIPESVTHLGEAAFEDCSGLTSVTILGPITRVNDDLFFDCSSLTNVSLPSTITYLGECAFEGTALTHFTIPNAVDSIMYSAFKDCTGLQRIDIPNSVTYIDDEVFWGCTSLTSVTIGNSVAEIYGEAFGACPSLTSIVVSEENPVFDSRDHCNGIIETATNKLNTGCKSTIIPNSVTIIGESAFDGISSMTSVTIPGSITLLETDAFEGCSGLASVICKAVTPPAMEDSYVFSNYTYSGATLYVPSSSLQAYRTTDYWKRFTNILPFEDYATAMPTITTELSIGAMTVAATGAGTVVLMVDGVVVDNPCDIPRTDQSRTVRVTATAQEEGKLVSDIATLDVTIPAILPLNTDNYLSMSDTTVVRGATVTIPVRMTNTSEIISFQTDISLAEGLEVVQEDGEYVIDRSDRMTRTHSLSSNRMSNGDIRVLCYSSNYKAFTGNSGDILFYITVRATGTADGAQSMTLKNTLFTDRDFNELRAPDAYATVTVLPYLKGDANGSGTVTVTDVVVTALRVLDYDPQPFVFESADVNEDGIISVTDVSRIAWMVLNPTQNSPLRSPVLCDNVDRMSGGDITLVPGQTRTVSISLDNVMSYSAFQLDLTLPEGLTASNFRLTDRAGGHTLDVNTLSNGAIRALCYSPSLATITGHGGALLTFDVTSMGSPTGLITVDGIECVTDACQTVNLDSFSIGVNTTTSVGELTAGKTVERIDYYNVSGQRVAQPVSGVTIVVTTYSDGSSEVTKLYR